MGPCLQASKLVSGSTGKHFGGSCSLHSESRQLEFKIFKDHKGLCFKVSFAFCSNSVLTIYMNIPGKNDVEKVFSLYLCH